MKKIAVFLLFFFVVGISSAFAGENIVIMAEDKLPSELNAWLVKTVCIEGQVFLCSFVLAGNAGAAVDSVQVFEEKDGKSVPMKCEGKKRKK